MSTETNNTGGEHEHDDSEPDAKVASWDEGQRRFGREMEKRKTRVYEIPTEDGEEPLIWEFEIKKLTGEERSNAEDAAVNVEEKGGSQEVSIDSRAVKREIIKTGVTDAPDGFKATDRHVERLLETAPEVAEDLVESIEDFSHLPEEDRVAF